MRVQASAEVRASKETVSGIYADYHSWPRLYAAKISSVRLVRRDGPKLVLEVDHNEGKVVNELVTRLPDELHLWESKRRYDAYFHNRFVSTARGSMFIVTGHIKLKGWARLLRPVLPTFARRQIMRWQIAPVKREAETRIRGAGGQA